MKKWYKESYFNSTNWILENFNKLGLTNDETILVLLIDLYRSNRKTITYDILCEKLNMNAKQVDTLIASLVNKHYLKISTNTKGIVFDIDSIYEFDPSSYEIAENNNIYNLVDELFGKPLSSQELQKMNDLIENYGQDKFLEATRIAEANRKLKMSYIEGILRNEK